MCHPWSPARAGTGQGCRVITEGRTETEWQDLHCAYCFQNERTILFSMYLIQQLFTERPLYRAQNKIIHVAFPSKSLPIQNWNRNKDIGGNNIRKKWVDFIKETQVEYYRGSKGRRRLIERERNDQKRLCGRGGLCGGAGAW